MMKATINELILRIVFLPVALFVAGLMIQAMWRWYVVPLGVIPLTLPHAIGLTIFATMLLLGITKDMPETIEDQIAMLILPFLFFFIGWIVSWWM